MVTATWSAPIAGAAVVGVGGRVVVVGSEVGIVVDSVVGGVAVVDVVVGAVLVVVGATVTVGSVTNVAVVGDVTTVCSLWSEHAPSTAKASIPARTPRTSVVVRCSGHSLCL